MASDKTILVVEDEDEVRELAIAQLKSAGYATLAASSAEEAIALLENRSPDAVLLDLEMPGKGGLDMLGELRSSPERKLPPMIAFSAYVDIDLVVNKTLELGVSGHVLKPYSRSELLETISAVLNGH